MRQGDSVRDSAEFGQSRPSGPAVFQYSTAFLQFEMKAFAKAGCSSQSRVAPSKAGMLPPEAHRLEKPQQCDFGPQCLSGSEGPDLSPGLAFPIV